MIVWVVKEVVSFQALGILMVWYVIECVLKFTDQQEEICL